MSLKQPFPRDKGTGKKVTHKGTARQLGHSNESGTPRTDHD